MKVSIITISFNANKTIEKTLSSVAGQSYNNIEHIIVDGGSKDNTLEICNSFHHVSKIISEPDNGVYDAFNKGLKLATGDIIGFFFAVKCWMCRHPSLFYKTNLIGSRYPISNYFTIFINVI